MKRRTLLFNLALGTVAHFKDRYECHILTLAGSAGQPAVPPPFLQTVRDDRGDQEAFAKLVDAGISAWHPRPHPRPLARR